MSTSLLTVDRPSLKLSSQVILACVKLTTKANYYTPKFHMLKSLIKNDSKSSHIIKSLLDNLSQLIQYKCSVTSGYAVLFREWCQETTLNMFMVGTIYIFKYSNLPLVEPTSKELMGMEDQLDFCYLSLDDLAHQRMTLLFTQMI